MFLLDTNVCLPAFYMIWTPRFRYVAAHKLLVEDKQFEAVVKLPAGVFRPYAGVSTAVLLFTKGGKTTDVWFYNVESDGFTLDDKRDKIGDDDDFQDVDDVSQKWAKWNGGKRKKHFADRTDLSKRSEKYRIEPGHCAKPYASNRQSCCVSMDRAVLPAASTHAGVQVDVTAEGPKVTFVFDQQ